MSDEYKAIVGALGVGGGALWKLREPIGAIWRRITERLLGRRQTVAITGMAGVGKSVLLDYLSEEARATDYDAPTAPSAKVEEGKVSIDTLRATVKVVPGQGGPRRLDALEDLIEGGEVDGVIHVVANGLAVVRDAAQRQSYASRGVVTIDQLRALHLHEELRDFEEVAAAVRKGRRKAKRPRWMIIAASKLDLCPAAREPMIAWYEHDPRSPFAQARRSFHALVGIDTFALVTRPLAVRLEDFEWEGTRAATSLEESTRARLLRELLETIDDLSTRPEP